MGHSNRKTSKLKLATSFQRRRFLLFVSKAVGTLFGAVFATTSIYRTSPLLLVHPPVTVRHQPAPYFMPYPPGCLHKINIGNWSDASITHGGGLFLHEACKTTPKYATCYFKTERRWKWSPEATACGAKYIDVKLARQILNNRWIAIVGDSIGRGIYMGMLLNLGLEDYNATSRNQDFNVTTTEGTFISFHFKPLFERAVPWLIQTWLQPDNARIPDAVIFSINMWDMQWYGETDEFIEKVQNITEVLRSITATATAKGKKRPVLFWMPAPDISINKVSRSTYRERLSMRDEYNAAFVSSFKQTAQQEAYSPFSILDIFRLSWGCGEECLSSDGIHQLSSLKQTAAQIFLNMYKYIADNDTDVGNKIS